MEETIYGIRAIWSGSRVPPLLRTIRPLPLDEQGGPRTIQFWKSWPDGARCLMLELRPEEVPSRSSPAPKSWSSGLEPWRMLALPRGGHYTFDAERDWWAAPADIEVIAMWVSSRTDPRFVVVTPRRG